jgi:hypothetical protein
LTPPEDLVSGSIGHRTPSRWGATGSWHVPAHSPTHLYDGPMTHPGRGPARTFSLLSGVLATIILVAACSGNGAAPTSAAASAGPSTTASPTTAVSPATASAGADLTPVPGGQTASPIEPSGPTQTDTAWGRIWDSVPASFPRVETSTPADSILGPVSAGFVVTARPADVTATMKHLLESAGYATDQSGPLEDGSFVLDSTGAPAGCRVQTTLAPQAGSTLMTVLFGAACPFE